MTQGWHRKEKSDASHSLLTLMQGWPCNSSLHSYYSEQWLEWLDWIYDNFMRLSFLLFQANCFSVEDNVLNIFWLIKIVEAQEQTVSISLKDIKYLARSFKSCLYIWGVHMTVLQVILFKFDLYELKISNSQTNLL